MFTVLTSVLKRLVTTDKLMLLQKVAGLLDNVTDVAGIARAQVMLPLKVNAHVVGLVGGVVTELAEEPAVSSPLGVLTHHVYVREEESYWYCCFSLGQESLCL